MRNQEEVNNSETSETDYLRVRASKINTKPQAKCTERGENSKKNFAKFFGFYKKETFAKEPKLPKLLWELK